MVDALFSQPLNDSMSRALPPAVEEIRRVHGPAPFTLVFDRAGHSGEALFTRSTVLASSPISAAGRLGGATRAPRFALRIVFSGWVTFAERKRVIIRERRVEDFNEADRMKDYR